MKAAAIKKSATSSVSQLGKRTGSGGTGGAWRKGYSLPGEYYNAEEHYRTDLMELAENHWQMVDHESRIPKAGDYFLFDFDDESIIIIRDRDGVVRAHYNVCRHRGSRICLEQSGSAKLLTCPYHVWSYDLDGTLKVAQNMPEDFKPEENGLRPCHVHLFEGLIFVNLSRGKPPDFEPFVARFRPFFRPFDFTHCKIATRKSLPTRANWKLVVENFLECYHCPNVHQAYCATHDMSVQMSYSADQSFTVPQAQWEATMRANGTYIEPFIDGPSERWFQTCTQMEIGYNNTSGTPDGGPAAPLLGTQAEYDGGWIYSNFNLTGYLIIYNDYAFMVRFTPRGLRNTDVDVTWLVRADAVEGKDYDLDRLTQTLGTIMQEDQTIVENNQLGVLSRAYTPGRYSRHESRPEDFAIWYMQHVGNKNAVPLED